MILKSLVEYIDDRLFFAHNDEGDKLFRKSVNNFIAFIEKRPTIEMFIPCDEDTLGDVLFEGFQVYEYAGCEAVNLVCGDIVILYDCEHKTFEVGMGGTDYCIEKLSDFYKYGIELTISKQAVEKYGL